MHSIFNCIAFISFISVCLETDLFVSVVSIWIRNTEMNRNKPKKNLLVSRNKPKNNRNRLSYGLFRFEPKFYFVCFEDTLTRGTGTDKGQDDEAYVNKLLKNCQHCFIPGRSCAMYLTVFTAVLPLAKTPYIWYIL
jgi:hypothetical protein